MRAKVRQLYISLFHAYARKNNMWILDHGEALLKVDPLQPAQRTGLIHCGVLSTSLLVVYSSTGYRLPATGVAGNRPLLYHGNYG